MQTEKPKGYKHLSLKSNRYTGPGVLKIKVQTESYMYTMGIYEVPNLVTPKMEILQVDQFVHYKWENSRKIRPHETST